MAAGGACAGSGWGVAGRSGACSGAGGVVGLQERVAGVVPGGGVVSGSEGLAGVPGGGDGALAGLAARLPAGRRRSQGAGRLVGGGEWRPLMFKPMYCLAVMQTKPANRPI